MSEVKPALTAEEWAKFSAGELHAGHWAMSGPAFDWPGKQGLAAVCLYGEPFGFDHEDAKNVMWAEHFLVGTDRSPETAQVRQWFASFRARLEALLPPVGGLPPEGEPRP